MATQVQFNMAVSLVCNTFHGRLLKPNISSQCDFITNAVLKIVNESDSDESEITEDSQDTEEPVYLSPTISN
jgi:hypothetical protein